MTLDLDTGDWLPSWGPMTNGHWPPALDPWPPRNTDGRQSPDYWSPKTGGSWPLVNTDDCIQESIEEKLDRIIVLLEQLVKYSKPEGKPGVTITSGDIE